MNGSSINHGLKTNIHTITTTRCVITQKGAVLIYFKVDAGNHARMQLLQDSNHSNVDNKNNVKCDACRHYRNKRRNV
jgi:hypothetical protein